MTLINLRTSFLKAAKSSAPRNMNAYFIFAAISAIALVFAEDAPESRDSPKDVIFRGAFIGFTHLVAGIVSFWSDTGHLTCALALVGSPFRGPYLYYISTKAVPPDKTCSDTGGILDTFGGKLDASSWKSMRIGDLSGKHGKIKMPYYQDVFDDPYLSLNKENADEYIGDCAFVIVDENDNFIACANLVEGHRSGKMVIFGSRQVPVEFADYVPKETGREAPI